MVVGTGDLSELGLGWCTYGVGDHMSHYNPNGSVSKTLIQHLIRFVAASGDVDEATAGDPARHPRHRDLARADSGRRGRRHPVDRAVGRPLCAAGFQPLLPDAARLPAVQDRLPRLERLARRRARAPGRPTCRRARSAPSRWPRSSKWLALFLRRFFTNQFKRSALPNGPKISSGGSLSPRGDWRAPSDGSPDVWLAELAGHVPGEVELGLSVQGGRADAARDQEDRAADGRRGQRRDRDLAAGRGDEGPRHSRASPSSTSAIRASCGATAPFPAPST